MRRFDYSFLKEKAWDNEIVGYLSQIHELKGKQMLYLRQKPADVEKLVEIAKIQSTESSNEIEGIRTTDTRLRQLMSEKTTPRTRDEKEIAGYRDALNTVHENFEYIPLTPNYILQLHKIMFAHTDSAFGGSFKNVQNYISATTADGRTYALFTPLAPYETQEAMRELCDAGGAIFFSTHVLEVAEKLCDKVAIIKGGRLIRSGTMEEVKGDDSLEDVFLELEDASC